MNPHGLGPCRPGPFVCSFRTVHFFALPCLRKPNAASHRNGLHVRSNASDRVGLFLPPSNRDVLLLGDRASSSHPFVPAGRRPFCSVGQNPSHQIQFTGGPPNQAGGADSRSRHDPKRVGPLRMRARRMFDCLLYYAAVLLCCSCQRRSRFQQISAIFRAVATRAIFAPERFRIRV